MTIVNGSDIFGKFFDVKFSIRECQTTNGAFGDLSNIRDLLLVNKVYVTENKHLLGTYAAVNQVTFHSKEIIHIFITYGDLVCSFCRDLSSQILQICSSGVTRPKHDSKKTERKTESKPRNRIFSR